MRKAKLFKASRSGDRIFKFEFQKLENFEEINTKGVHKGDTTPKTLVLQGVKCTMAEFNNEVQHP